MGIDPRWLPLGALGLLALAGRARGSSLRTTTPKASGNEDFMHVAFPVFGDYTPILVWSFDRRELARMANRLRLNDEYPVSTKDEDLGDIARLPGTVRPYWRSRIFEDLMPESLMKKLDQGEAVVLTDDQHQKISKAGNVDPSVLPASLHLVIRGTPPVPGFQLEGSNSRGQRLYSPVWLWLQKSGSGLGSSLKTVKPRLDEKLSRVVLPIGSHPNIPVWTHDRDLLFQKADEVLAGRMNDTVEVSPDGSIPGLTGHIELFDAKGFDPVWLQKFTPALGPAISSLTPKEYELLADLERKPLPPQGLFVVISRQPKAGEDLEHIKIALSARIYSSVAFSLFRKIKSGSGLKTVTPKLREDDPTFVWRDLKGTQISVADFKFTTSQGPMTLYARVWGNSKDGYSGDMNLSLHEGKPLWKTRKKTSREQAKRAAEAFAIKFCKDMREGLKKGSSLRTVRPRAKVPKLEWIDLLGDRDETNAHVHAKFVDYMLTIKGLKGLERYGYGVHLEIRRYAKGKKTELVATHGPIQTLERAKESAVELLERIMKEFEDV